MLRLRSKQAIQRLAASFGYQVEKIRPTANPLDVFDLAVHLLLARRQTLFFVQIGAHDGITGDPLRKFVLKYHLPGILVEPNPAVFKKLVANYRGEPQLRFENVAVGPTQGTKSLYLPATGDN